MRQLENLIKRLVVLGTEAGISKELLQPVVSTVPRPLPPPAPRRVAPPPVDVVDDEDEPGVAVAAGATSVSLKDIARTAAREAERGLILRMLTRTRWNRKEAAENLGISYKALLYKIKENGLDKAS